MARRTCAFRAAACYHLFVAAAAVLGGIALLIVGFWLSTLPTEDVSVSGAAPPKAGGNGTAAAGAGAGALAGGGAGTFFSTAAGIKLLGALLALFGATSLLAARKRCIGVTFRALYLALAVGFVALLGFVCVASLVTLAGEDEGMLRKGMRDEWRRLIAGARGEQQNEAGKHKHKVSGMGELRNATGLEAVCSLQYGLQCQGFDDGDCVGCKGNDLKACKRPRNCVDCSRSAEATRGDKAPSPKRGCFRAQVAMMRSAETVTTAVSGFLLLVIVLDVFVSCRFPLHVTDLVLRGADDDQLELDEDMMEERVPMATSA